MEGTPQINSQIVSNISPPLEQRATGTLSLIIRLDCHEIEGSVLDLNIYDFAGASFTYKPYDHRTFCRPSFVASVTGYTSRQHTPSPPQSPNDHH